MEPVLPDHPYGRRCKGPGTRAASSQGPTHSQKDLPEPKTSAHLSSGAAIERRPGERSPDVNERLAVHGDFAPVEVRHQDHEVVQEEEEAREGWRAGR